MHRDNDLPAIKNNNGASFWFKEGLLHREKEPAVIKREQKHYWVNNQLHNEDNYAYFNIENNEGLYFIKDKLYSEKNFNVLKQEKLLSENIRKTDNQKKLKV